MQEPHSQGDRCGFVCRGFLIPFLINCTPPVSPPTLSPDEIATAAFQTALVLNQQTQTAYSTTATFTSSPTATDTMVPTIPPATDTPLSLTTATSVAIPVTGDSYIPDNLP